MGRRRQLTAEAAIIGVAAAAACARSGLRVDESPDGGDHAPSAAAGAPAQDPPDATAVVDAEPALDVMAPRPEAGPQRDTGPPPDAGPPPDSGPLDASPPPDADPPPDAPADASPPPPLEWTRAFLGEDRCTGTAVATGSDGSVYAVGWFKDSVDFDPGPSVDGRSAVGTAIFLTKLDQYGHREWTHTWGGDVDAGSGWGDEGDAVLVLPDGRVVVAGQFEGTIDFDPGPGVDEHTSVGAFDAFVMVLGANGEYVWTRTWGSPNRDRASGIAPAPNGAVYVTGQFEGSADLDPGAAQEWHFATGEIDCYAIALDDTGNLVWVRTWGGPGIEYRCDVASGPSGSATAAGDFQQTADFDPGPGVDERTSAGGDDAFVLKIWPDGTADWARTWGGTSAEMVGDVALTPNGSVLTTGFFYALADFDPSPGEDWHDQVGSYDAFLTRLARDGPYEWTVTWGGDTAADRVGAVTVTAHDDGTILAAGGFEGTVDFDPGPSTDVRTSAGSYDAYVSAIGADGIHQWTRVVGGVEHDMVSGVDTYGDYAVVAGSFRDTVDFDFGGTSEAWTAPESGYGCFVSRFAMP